MGTEASLHQILKAEFDAEEGSFLLQLKGDFVWDTDAFDRLTGAMAQYCRESRGDSPTVERWLAEGFWFVPDWVPMWTSHPNFPRPYSKEYYDRAYERLHDLAFWFFVGESPYVEGYEWKPLRP